MPPPFVRRTALAALMLVLPAVTVAQETARAERPFGTLREQAAMQQAWLKKRLDTFLPALMRKHAIDLWVVPMREYNEDPVFSSITAPETFAARRRTIYVFFDKCAAANAPVAPSCVERIALGGTSQGGVFDARTSAKPVVAAVGGRQAELWGDEQWQALKQVIEERKPKVIGIDRSKTFAFTDGLSSGELQGMSEALGAHVDGKVPRCRRVAARADRLATAGGRSVLREDDRARLADDADDVLGEGHRAGHNPHERPRVVVASAHERSRTGHLVPAQCLDSAEGREERAARRRPGDSAWRRAALRRGDHGGAPEHRHAAQRLCPAPGRDRRAGRAQEGAGQRQRHAGHRDGRNAARPHRQRDPGLGAPADERPWASTARCTRTRLACTGTGPAHSSGCGTTRTACLDAAMPG